MATVPLKVARPGLAASVRPRGRVRATEVSGFSRTRPACALPSWPPAHWTAALVRLKADTTGVRRVGPPESGPDRRQGLMIRLQQVTAPSALASSPTSTVRTRTPRSAMRACVRGKPVG